MDSHDICTHRLGYNTLCLSRVFLIIRRLVEFVRSGRTVLAKRTPTRLVGVLTAEDRGFEPLRDCSQHAFQACDIGR